MIYNQLHKQQLAVWHWQFSMIWIFPQIPDTANADSMILKQ